MNSDIYKSNLDKLKIGCFLRALNKENEEPGNAVLERASYELKFLQRQTEYANEIDRVLREIRLTHSLIKKCNNTELIEGTSLQDLITYYQGIFFTLVHQIKDKIIQLVNLVTEESIPDKPHRERKISVAQLIQRKSIKLSEIGIIEEIKQWEESNATSKIAVVLRKRTQHHHYVSRLRYDKDTVNLGFTDLAIQPNVSEYFTDYGKKQIIKMRLESTEKLVSNAIEKSKDTLNEIENNIEKISGAILVYFKFPVDPEDMASILNRNMEMYDSFEIRNKCSMNNVIEPFKSIIDELVKETKDSFQEQISSIYLVGSLGRGEFEEGYSDINIYIVFNIEDEQDQFLIEDGLLSIRNFSRASFLSEKFKKYRAIAKADGILLYGEDLVKKENLKAGLLLALILNEDILDILDDTLKWIEDNPSATPQEVGEKSRRLSKCIIDFIYGSAVANKPQYTSSRAERVERINQIFPNNKVKTDMLVNVARYGIGKLESLKYMIEDFRPIAERNLRKMLEVKDNIEKQKSPSE